MAIGIAGQVYAGVILEKPIIAVEEYQSIDEPTQHVLNIAPLLNTFLPCCLPLVPLLFMLPKRPVYTAALALVGRWSDAAREMEGFRWVLVAAGVIALRAGLPEAVRWWIIDENGRLAICGSNEASSMAPFVMLFGLAALPGAPRSIGYPWPRRCGPPKHMRGSRRRFSYLSPGGKHESERRRLGHTHAGLWLLRLPSRQQESSERRLKRARRRARVGHLSIERGTVEPQRYGSSTSKGFSGSRRERNRKELCGESFDERPRHDPVILAERESAG